jgi:hypothetical protein
VDTLNDFMFGAQKGATYGHILRTMPLKFPGLLPSIICRLGESPAYSPAITRTMPKPFTTKPTVGTICSADFAMLAMMNSAMVLPKPVAILAGSGK